MNEQVPNDPGGAGAIPPMILAFFIFLLCALVFVLPKAWEYLSWLFGGG